MSRVIKNGYKSRSIKPYDFYMDFEDKENTEDDTGETIKKRGGKHISPEEELLSGAMEQSKEILNAAKAQGEDLRKEAYEIGRKEGYEAGFQTGYDKAYEDHMAQLKQEISDFEEELVTFIEDMELKKQKVLEMYLDDLKKIALAVAEKIIKTSLKTSGDIVKRMIVAATDKLKKTQWVKIYITKNDSSRLIKGDMDLINELTHLSDNIKLIVMDNEEDGNCIIELPDEIIDVSVNTQLENIKDILNNARL